MSRRGRIRPLTDPVVRERRAPRRAARAEGGLRDAWLAAAALYAIAVTAVGMFVTWPIYADPAFLVATGTAAAAGILLAGLTVWRALPWWAVALAAAAIVLVVGVVVAVPPATPAGILTSLRSTVAGAVTGFKDLVTVNLPVGTYRNLLVPAVLVFTIAPLGTVLIGRRRTRVGAFGVVFAWTMPLYGLLFGLTVTSAPITVGPVTIPAPREQLGAALTLVCSLIWLAWRVAAGRRAALQRAAAAGGLRWSRKRTGSDIRRAALAAALVAVAVVGASAVAPAIAQSRPREVLRSATGPELQIARAVTPLTDYRTAFTDPMVNRALFTVTPVDGPLPDRVRLATLSWYDGVAYRVSDPGAGRGDFVRVPSTLPASGPTSTARITVQGLSGIFLPSFGQLQEVRFAGGDAGSRADAFYYDAPAQAAVETAGGGVRSGVSYTMTSASPPVPALSAAKSPHAEPQVTIPSSVKTWVAKQDAGADGAALQTLVERLRQRGYLSHALSVPAGGAAWEKALGDRYTFQPSASGHSLGRIDTLFQQLLTRQQQAQGKPGASLVAGVGDDEQFAVATALVAQTLGFPARVVVGARLTGGDDGVPSCAGGVCRGGDLTAWTEVQSSSGDWIPVDATPQHTVGVTDTVVRQRDPENATDARPSTAQEVVPPDPVQRDAAHAPAVKQQDAGPAALWAALRVAGIFLAALVILLGPLLVILGAKAVRRRGRRNAPDTAGRVVGGWDEFVDAAVDHGMPVQTGRTRVEFAREHAEWSAAERAEGHAATLAAVADHAVFSDAALSDAEAGEFWRIVDEERRRLAASLPVVRRVLAALSLRSFLRELRPARARARRAARTTEGRGPGTTGA
ncbi:transglutaminase-like domain-containing protein [Microbacterium mangrovi]|uniref:transglutaminase-like domain-containing protein n=1 Tax=Microbacterium mangrovi TaxID=1348253 RepID=UPI00068F2ACE|nr:transglutaminase-like domain-containing protein [Microbacterium mangrovi]